MKPGQLLLLDGIKWQIAETANGRIPFPICPRHNLRLHSAPKQTELNPVTLRQQYMLESDSQLFICAEGQHEFRLSRPYHLEQAYVLDTLGAPSLANMEVVNLDDQIIPVAKEELKDSDYWVRAKVTKSKTGTRLIVWAGSKAEKNKAQLFVEPEIERLSFDHNDDHPNEVFAKVEATFKNSKHSLNSRNTQP